MPKIQMCACMAPMVVKEVLTLQGVLREPFEIAATNSVIFMLNDRLENVETSISFYYCFARDYAYQ